LEQGYEEGERELLKKIKYVDDEGDWITVAAEEEWEEAVRIHRDVIRVHICP